MNQIIVNFLEEKIEEYSDIAKYAYKQYQYYCWDENIRYQLINVLKTRSKYKRALKEYEELYFSVIREKYKKVIEQYRKHPDKFIEDMYGVKLNTYQKMMLNLFTKK